MTDLNLSTFQVSWPAVMNLQREKCRSDAEINQTKPQNTLKYNKQYKQNDDYNQPTNDICRGQ